METITTSKGMIFDLDGTLLDSMQVWNQIDIEFLTKRGIKIPDDYIETIKDMEFIQVATYTIERFHLKETPENLLQEWQELAIYHYANTIKLKPYVKEFLISLTNTKIGIATSLSKELCIPALKNNGIYDIFDSLTTTNEVKRGKEYPDVYLLEANKLGLKPCDCVVFEDSLVAIQGANKGGFFTVGVYDESSAHQKDNILKESDYYITSFSQFL